MVLTSAIFYIYIGILNLVSKIKSQLHKSTVFYSDALVPIWSPFQNSWSSMPLMLQIQVCVNMRHLYCSLHKPMCWTKSSVLKHVAASSSWEFQSYCTILDMCGISFSEHQDFAILGCTYVMSVFREYNLSYLGLSYYLVCEVFGG